MNLEPPTLVLPVLDIVGYWGLSNRPDRNRELQQQLSRIAPPVPNQIHSPPNEDDLNVVWGVAFSDGDCSLNPSPSSEQFNGNTLPVPCLVQLGLSIAGYRDDKSFDASVMLGHDRLVLQREGFGRVPLYWRQHGEVIWFASRWQWLLPLCDRREISIPAAYGYACFSYVPTPLTPIADIANLPAGTQQAWTRCSTHPSSLIAHPLQSTQTWHEAREQLQDESLAIAQLQTLLQNAIQAQTADLQNEPVGVFLSGGLDSSIVAALLVQAGFKVRAYTLDFGEVSVPELPYAAQVAEYLNIPLVAVEATPRKIRSALVPTAQALDLPFGDGVTVPLYLLAQAASQDVGIVFNGEGGDQLFAGWTNKPLIAAGVYQAEQPQTEPFIHQYLRTFHRLWGYEAQVLQPEVWAQVQTLNPETWLQSALDTDACPSLLHQLRRATLMLKGAQNIHPRATAIGRAHRLNVRSPFCFLPLAHWAFQLSSELHLQGSCEKYILKRAVADWLPPEIVWRTKRGMGVPLTTWCLGELWHDLGNWLNPAQLQQGGIWHPHIANRIVTGQLGTIQGRRLGECLWLLLMWQVWQQTVWGDAGVTFSLNHPFWLPPWLGRVYCRFQKGNSS